MTELTPEQETQRAAFHYMAKINENAERFDEMVESMRGIAMMDADFTLEERNLLSVAYKNVVGSRRAAWRIVSSIELKEKTRGHNEHIGLLSEYKRKIEGEIRKFSDDMVDMIDNHLVLNTKSAEAKAFFYKMKGDYRRYLAEVTEGTERTEFANEALSAYQRATSLAISNLAPTHPVRLGLALNFSVFYYEIFNSPERACQLAKSAFGDAVQEMDQLTEDSYKDALLILHLLRDNLSLWSSAASNEAN